LGGGDQNGPKQRQMRRLGSRYVIFSFFRVIANVFILLMYYQCFKKTWRVKVGGDDRNGPKRRVSRRLGYRYFLSGRLPFPSFPTYHYEYL
jgi:hypothetical protein